MRKSIDWKVEMLSKHQENHIQIDKRIYIQTKTNCKFIYKLYV